MTETRDLIDALIAGARPVRRALSPLAATSVWCGVGLAGGALAVLTMGPCVYLPARLAEPLYLVWAGATLLASVCAAVAAGMSARPDRARSWRMLPLPAVAVSVGAVAARCLMAADVARDAADASAPKCAAVFFAFACAMATSLWILTRRAPLRDSWATAWLAGLAVAGLATAGVSLVRTFVDPAPMLIWNLAMGGAAAAMLAVGWRWAARWRPTA